MSLTVYDIASYRVTVGIRIKFIGLRWEGCHNQIIWDDNNSRVIVLWATRGSKELEKGSSALGAGVKCGAGGCIEGTMHTPGSRGRKNYLERCRVEMRLCAF